MKLIEHFINGKKYSGDSKRYSTIFNPATGEESGKVNLGSTNDLNEAVKNAKKAVSYTHLTLPTTPYV